MDKLISVKQQIFSDMDESVFSQDRCHYLFFCNAQCFLINASWDRNTKGAGAQKYLNANCYYTFPSYPLMLLKSNSLSLHTVSYTCLQVKALQNNTHPQKEDLQRFLGKQTSHKTFNWTHPHNSSYSRFSMLAYAIRPTKWKKKLGAHLERMKCLLILKLDFK